MKSRTAEKNSEQLKQLFGKNPNSLLFSRIADLYRKEGNINQAIELCQKGLETHPEYVTGRIILGRCYIEKENYDNAIDEFISVCKLDRKNLVAIKMLADVFVKRGETGKAGDLYRILTLLDPFDASFKILASRFDTTGKKELLDILGVQPVADVGFSRAPSAPEPSQFSEEFSGTPEVTDQFSSGEDNFGDNSVDQMLSSFAEEEPVSGNDTDFRMSGSDIDDRMNTLFGEQEQATTPSLLSGITEQQSLDNEIRSLVSEDTSSGQPVSGNDISSRIDELFDSSGSNNSDVVSNPRGDITEKLYIDNGFASELKQIHSEQLSLENTDEPESDGMLSDTMSGSLTGEVVEEDDLTDSFSDKIVPFSTTAAENDLLTDEFEETLQFDRSMFSRLNDEPDYEELVSSSPFMSMGKTDELFEDQDIELVDNESLDGGSEDADASEKTDEHSELSPLDYLASNVFPDEIDKEVNNIQLETSSGDVLEHTVLDDAELLRAEPRESVEADVENEAGFISGEHFSEKLDSIFGSESQMTSELPENPLMELSDFSNGEENNSTIEDDNILSGSSALTLDDSAAESPEFNVPDLLADFNLEDIDVSGENDTIDKCVELEDISVEKIPDIDSSFMPSEENILSDNNNGAVRDSSDDNENSDELDIFDDLPATLETIRKSDVDKLRGFEQEIESDEREENKPEILESDELVDEGEVEQHAIIIENDSIPDTNVAVGVTDTDVSLSESVTELSGIEDHLQIDDPVLLVDSDSHDIILDDDDGVVSDMDVLVVSPEDEQMTGDDVADKIQDIFDMGESGEKKHFSFDESSLELVEDSDESATNERLIPESSEIAVSPAELTIEDENEFTSIISENFGDSEPLSDKPLATDLVIDSEPEETMILIDDSAEESNGISGSDVEERIDEYFGKDILGDLSMNKLVPEDDEADETLIQDFYTLSGENTATASGNESLEGLDDVEIDHTVDFIDEAEDPQQSAPVEISVNRDLDALPEMLDEECVGESGVLEPEALEPEALEPEAIEPEAIEPEAIDLTNVESEMIDSTFVEKSGEEVSDRFSAADLFDSKAEEVDAPDLEKTSALTGDSQPLSIDLEIDNRDAPYNIPDHVLTPTLADIYFQQGQLQLALQIYSRLLDKDPDNDRIQGRILEIKTSMELHHEEQLTHQNSQSEKIDKKTKIKAFPKENSSTADSRPLAGVRIPKKKKAARRDHKKKD